MPVRGPIFDWLVTLGGQSETARWHHRRNMVNGQRSVVEGGAPRPVGESLPAPVATGRCAPFVRPAGPLATPINVVAVTSMPALADGFLWRRYDLILVVRFPGVASAPYLSTRLASM